jgi:hypothetical protein
MNNKILARRIFPIILFIFLFNNNIFPQVVIKERIEIDPTDQTPDGRTNEGDGWWIGGCYIETYDSSEIDLRLEPSSIEPGETAIMKLYYCFYGNECEYDEESYNLLERNLTLEPNLGTITRIGNGEYEYHAPNQTPGDTALVVTVNYEQFIWGCAFANGQRDSSRANNNLEELDCGCPLWTWTFVSRNYGTDSIMIAWDSLDVKVEPDTIYPGDTAQVVIKKRLPDGTLTDFDSTQTYEVGMLDGCILGKIVAGEEEGPHVVDVLQPIYFVADTSADTTGAVLLRVGLIPPADKPQNKNNLQKGIVESDCFVGWQSNSFDDVSVVKENPLEIIYPTNNSPDEWITSAPEMPEVSYAVILHNHLGQPVKLICEYEVSFSYQRRWSPRSPICNRTSKVIYYDTLDAYGGVVYVNPVVFTKDKATFEFKARGHRGSGCNEIITTWDEGNEVFTGGNVIIRVTATDLSWDAFAFKEQVANKILGSNPDSIAIAQYANNEIRAILYFESKENQFTGEGIDTYYWWPYNEAGFPLYGQPNGYGLMQLDNPWVATEKQLWNWKANIDGGIQRLQIAKDEVDEYISLKGASSEEKYRLTNAYQNYRGGKLAMYYVWKGRAGWKENEGAFSYGKNVYDKYIELGGGN